LSGGDHQRLDRVLLVRCQVGCQKDRSPESCQGVVRCVTRVLSRGELSRCVVRGLSERCQRGCMFFDTCFSTRRTGSFGALLAALVCASISCINLDLSLLGLNSSSPLVGRVWSPSWLSSSAFFSVSVTASSSPLLLLLLLRLLLLLLLLLSLLLLLLLLREGFTSLAPVVLELTRGGD